jgi:hypothetical protein
MRDHARVLSLAAAEAVGEPDTITRRPEIIDALLSLSSDPALADTVERVAPSALGPDPVSEVKRLADALAPYRECPLDDAPELVERLLLVAWLLNKAISDDQPTSETPALTAV